MFAYWFLYGNYDAWVGRYDAPPCSVGRMAHVYQTGQNAGRAGRFYRHLFPR